MFKLTILSKEKMIFEGDVSSLMVPGIVGYLEILTNHAPVITALQPGKLTFKEGNQRKVFAISGGAFEFSDNQALVLGDAIEAPEEIDLKRAEEVQYKFSKLIENTDDSAERKVMREILSRANIRIKVAKSQDDINP